MNAMDLAKQRLYGTEGLAAQNVGIFPGSGEDTSAKRIAEQLNHSLDQLEAGDYEDVILD